jgi:hypothetical protein
LDRGELIAEFARHRFQLAHSSERTVRDGKKMLALDLRRQ